MMFRKVIVLLGMCGILTAGLIAAACNERDGEEGDHATKVRSTEDVPASVRALLARFAPAGAKAEDMEREEEHGLVTWSAEYETAAGDVEITALSDGTLVAVEEESTPSALPPAVAAAARATLDGKIEKADHVRLAVYEIEDAPTPGTVRERFVDPFGRVVFERTHEAAPENDRPEEMTALPVQVRTTIERETGGAEITGLEAGNEWGHTVHAASWDAPDGRRDVKVLDDGQVLYVELPTGPVPSRVAELAEDSGGYPEEVDAAEDAREDGEHEEAEHREGTGDAEEKQPGERAESGEESGRPTAAIERMLLEAWEVRGEQDGSEVELLILPTGEIVRSEAHPEAD